MRTTIFPSSITILLTLGMLLPGSSLLAQPAKLPTAEEIKALQAKYQQEREKVVKDGSAKLFIPVLMDKADELAKKAETALTSGRLLQASEAIRQARWQLPYQPGIVPEHVSRIIGNLRLRHSREINAIAFSPDGTKLATAGGEFTVKIWDLGNGHELLAYTGHTDKVKALAWSPDGKAIISAGNEKNIKIWDPQTGKDILTIPAAGEYVSALALSRDGKHLFTGQLGLPGASANGLCVHEIKTGKLLREVRDFANKISTLALHPDGNILAAGDDNGRIHLFQYPSFIENANQPAYWSKLDPTGATYHLTFSPDGKTLVRCGPLGIKFYATVLPGTPFEPVEHYRAISTPIPRCAVYSKDGKTLFSGDNFGNISFWDPETALLQGTYKNVHSNAINALVFNPDGTQLASCAGDFVVRLMDFDVVLQSRDFIGHEGPVWTAAFSPDGQKVISASADKTVKVWQRETGKVLFTIADHTAPVTVALFSPDGKLIASAGGDKIIRIFDADTGKPLRTLEGHQGTITFLDFSHDSKRLVSSSADRRLKIWNADDGKEILAINDNPAVVAAVVFSPDGKQIALANIDQSIRLLDASTGKLQHSWNAHGTSVNGVAYSPNGKYLASCGSDTLVQVWPLATPGLNPIRFAGHTGPVSMVAFRKDNQYLVSCGADQLVKLWKLEGNEGKEKQTFRGHKDWVTAVAFTAEGYHVVSSSVDRTLKVWEITSRDIPLLAEHSSAVYALAVSPDNKLIATGAADQTIKLWDRATGVEIATLTGHPSAVLSLIFTPDSKGLLSSGSDNSIHLWTITPPAEVQRSPQQLNAFKRMLRASPYISLDPTGKTVFAWLPPSTSESNTGTLVEAYDIESGNQLFSFKEDNRKVNSLAFSANGKVTATGAKDGSISLWQIDKNTPRSVPGGDWLLFDKVSVADIALTPDGAILVATSDEGEIKVGKIAGREVLHAIKGHQGKINNCITSPDGKTFATVGADNLVKAWDIASGKELRRWDLGKHDGMFLINLAFTADSRQLVSANANTTVYVLDLP